MDASAGNLTRVFESHLRTRKGLCNCKYWNTGMKTTKKYEREGGSLMFKIGMFSIHKEQSSEKYSIRV